MISLAFLYPYPDFKNSYFEKFNSDQSSYELNPDQLNMNPSSVYFDIMVEIGKKQNRVSYVIITSEEFARENNIKLPYYTKDLDNNIELVFTDNIESIALYLNQFKNMIVRGNYIFWRALEFLLPDKNYLMLPCYSKINAELLKYNPKRKVVFVDETKLIDSFKEKNIKAEVFKKPASKIFYTDEKIQKEIDFLFVCSSTDRMHKRFDLILDSLEYLNKNINKKLIFGVVGNTDHHKEKIQELSKLKNIEIIQHWRLMREDLKHIYLKSKLTICSSSIDSNPRIISESMACGTPVLCANDLEAGKFQINQKNGSFFEPVPEKLASKIISMLKNIEKYDARNNVFSIKDSIDQISKYCERG